MYILCLNGVEHVFSACVLVHCGSSSRDNLALLSSTIITVRIQFSLSDQEKSCLRVSHFQFDAGLHQGHPEAQRLCNWAG